MIFTKKSIKSLNFQKTEVIIKLNLLGKLETHNIDDIDKIFIKIKKTKDFYFIDTISLLIFALGLLACWIRFYTSFYISLMLLLCWTLYLINNRVYYLRIKLKNGQSYNYYFTKSIKYDILEKIKIIRGKL
jgi:hypothetical protein